MDFRNAFILWRGLGIDYEGGVLDAPARVAIHYTHRLGAYVTAFVLLMVVAGAWRRGQSKATRIAAIAVGVAVVLQVAIGMNLVWKGWPLSLGTAHNARRGTTRSRDGRAAQEPEPALGSRPLPAVAALGRQRYWITTGRPAISKARHTESTDRLKTNMAALLSALGGKLRFHIVPINHSILTLLFSRSI